MSRQRQNEIDFHKATCSACQRGKECRTLRQLGGYRPAPTHREARL